MWIAKASERCKFTLTDLTSDKYRSDDGYPICISRIQDPTCPSSPSFEMAFRMQTSAPKLLDLSDEPKHILDQYGVDPASPSLAQNCLLARRLVERGVRVVQLFHESWDQHGRALSFVSCVPVEWVSSLSTAGYYQNRLKLLPMTSPVLHKELDLSPVPNRRV